SIATGNTELVRALLNHGADPERPQRAGDRPLHLAALNHLPAALQALLEHPIHIESRNDQGMTPLMYANDECARMRLEHGADVDARDRHGCTCLSYVHSNKTYQ